MAAEPRLAGKVHITGPLIYSVAEPPEMAVVALLVIVSKFVTEVLRIPEVNVSILLTLTDPPKLAPVLLLIMRLLKVEAGIVCNLLPSKVTVPPQVKPPETGATEVFCVLIVPALLTTVTLNTLVPIFNVPPDKVFIFAAVIDPPAVFVLPELLLFSIL